MHGAIGFTREYDLQRFTRRLWCWRGEYGNERHWAEEIGSRAARAGSDGFWPALVSGFAARATRIGLRALAHPFVITRECG